MGVGRRRVVWSAEAHRELDKAISYIAEDSVDSALRVLEQILESTQSLSTLADRGRIVPERGDPKVRELLVNPFRILCYVGDSTVVILGVLNQRRDHQGWSAH